MRFLFSLSLFSVIIQLFGVITALGRVIGDVGGERGGFGSSENRSNACKLILIFCKASSFYYVRISLSKIYLFEY